MIRCESCDELLVDSVDVTSLTIRGERVPFRRSSDYLACENCGALRSVRSLRAELVARGEIDTDAIVTRPESENLREVVEEALEEVRGNARASSEPEAVEDLDAALALLSDLAMDAETGHERVDTRDAARDVTDENPPSPA